MSDTKIKTSNIGNLAVTHALLHTDMDLTSKTVQVATPTSNTHPATKAYVDTEVANLIDSAPGTLDTLNELAAAIGDDANFAATVTTGLSNKLPLAGGTMTGVIAGFESTGIDDNAANTSVTILSDGKVGIGIESPVRTLDVDSSTSSDIARFGNDSGTYTLGYTTDLASIDLASSAGLRIRSGSTLALQTTSAGHVGIGTSQPDLTLHVDGVNGYPATSGSTPVGHIAIRAKNESSSHGATIGVANASPWGTWIQAQDAGNLATNYPLLLNPNGGNVGIGTDTPQRTLHVVKNGSIAAGNGYDVAIFQNNDAAGIRLVDAGDGGSNGGNAGLGNDNGNLNVASAGVMTFSTNLAANAALYGGASTGGTERMRIAANGNVGIGNNNPGYHIDARGGSATADGMRVKTGDNGYDGLIVSNSAILKCYPAAGQSVSLQAYNSVGSTKTGVKVTGADTPNGEISTKLEFVTELFGHNVYDNSNYGTSNDQYVDLEDWSPADFRILEIFGTANPNSGGSGAYADPVHMYVYCGSGWNGAELTYYVYGKSVAPLARDIYSSGSGNSANVAEVWWYNNSTTAQQDAATYGTASGYHLRLKFPNTNTTYGTNVNLKVIKRA